MLTKHGGIAVSDTKTKKRYVLGAANLAKYLGIGTPHLVSNMEEISGKGIIYFENKHIDLYDASIGEMIGNGVLREGSDLKLVKIFFMPLQD